MAHPASKPTCALLLAGMLASLSAPTASAGESFVNFESGHVRPLAYLPGSEVKLGSESAVGFVGLLFAVNTPDNRLAIYFVKTPRPQEVGGKAVAFVFPVFREPVLELAAEVPVGLEPVAVAARVVDSVPTGVFRAQSRHIEAWVVNHLSDSISIVRIDGVRARDAYVQGTLLVCDEPRDIVFAGVEAPRAFLTAARRGQHCTVEAKSSEPSVGRAIVQVYDANAPFDANRLEGNPLATIELEGDTPRALAASPSGLTVYAAVFRSGNQTTTVRRQVVDSMGGLPPPSSAFPAGNPSTGLIVQRGADGTWKSDCFDPSCRKDLTSGVDLELPDYDVFAIDAEATPPVELPELRFSGAGTVLFDMAVAREPPTSCLVGLALTWYTGGGVPRPCDLILVSNTEARNAIRTELALRDGFVESRITAIGVRSNQVSPLIVSAGPPDGQRLASPMGMAVSTTGFIYRHRPTRPLNPRSLVATFSENRRLYVAGFSSNNIGVFDTESLGVPQYIDLEKGSGFDPRIGKGPTGLVLDEERNCLYVMNRFDQSISVICPADRANEAVVRNTEWLPDPSPNRVYAGRRFLYDARHRSASGVSSCSGCHVFGDVDDLAWDLGDPAGEPVLNVNPFIDDPDPACAGEPCRSTRVPHCENDLARECIVDSDCPPGTGICKVSGPKFCSFDATVSCSSDSQCAVMQGGQVVFQGLCLDARRFAPMKGPMVTQSLRGMREAGPMHWRGDRFDRSNPLDEVAAFEQFNPAFVSLLGGVALKEGEMDAYREFALTLRYPPNPIADLSGAATDERLFFDEKTDFGNRTCNDCHRVPLGADGRSSFEAAPQEMKIPHLRNMYQKVGMLPDASKRALRGFGYTHDGSVPSLFAFVNIPLFTFPGDALPVLAAAPRQQIEEFMLRFPTGLAPIVGQQVTVGATPSPVVDEFLANKLIARAQAGDCDLVVRGRLSGKWRGWLYEPSLSDGSTVKRFRRDDDLLFDDSQVRAGAAVQGQTVTYTCAPPGSGRRMGIDRDSDGVVDGKDTSTDPPKHVVQ